MTRTQKLELKTKLKDAFYKQDDAIEHKLERVWEVIEDKIVTPYENKIGELQANIENLEDENSDLTRELNELRELI